MLKEAHILPPQVTEVSLILGREAPCPAAVAEANTVAQMVAAVAQAKQMEDEAVAEAAALVDDVAVALAAEVEATRDAIVEAEAALGDAGADEEGGR